MSKITFKRIGPALIILVIIAGNSFNPDIDLYEHEVLIQCDIVK